MGEIIFIEGAPCSGKTTYLNILKDRLKCKNVRVFKEHYCDGIDISCQAYLRNDEFICFLEEIKRIKTNETDKLLTDILENSRKLNNGFWLISFAYLNARNDLLAEKLKYLYDKEIPNRGVSFDQYREIVLDLWRTFISNNIIGQKDVWIFEGALIQNHLYNLLGFYTSDITEILGFINQLLSILKCKYTVYVVEYSNYSKSILLNARNRSKGNYNWENGFNKWLINSKLKKDVSITEFCLECSEIYRRLIDKNIHIKMGGI